ncbi:MAG: RepB family plasmid replication initiator protein [Myxococcota bacterium]
MQQLETTVTKGFEKELNQIGNKAANGNTKVVSAEAEVIQVKGLKHALYKPLLLQQTAIPNTVLRSSLFGIISKGKREQVKNKMMFTCGSTSITFTGELLGQDDLDVFMASIKKIYDSGSFCANCSLYWLRKTLGLAKGKSSSDRIKASLERLTEATIKIRTSKVYYCGHPIDYFKFDKRVQRYKLKINPDIAGLFQQGYAKVNLETRYKLKGDFAKFLHGLVASHEAPYHRPQKYSLGKLRGLCNSQDGNNSRFKASIKKVMTQFKESNIICNWGIDGNIFWFTKT